MGEILGVRQLSVLQLSMLSLTVSHPEAEPADALMARGLARGAEVCALLNT